MRILLVPFVTDLNRGDQALIWESINLIKDIYDNPEIVLMRGDDESQYHQTMRLGYPSIKSILRHPRRNYKSNDHIRYTLVDKILMGVLSICDFVQTGSLLLPINIVRKVTLRTLPQELRQSYEVYKTCDAIFIKGGGFIHSYGSVIEPYQMYFNLYSVLLGIAMKKDIYLLPNSIGPLKNRLAAKIAEYVLNHCKYVSVRESKSFEFLKNRKQLSAPVYLHYDLGYYLKASEFDAQHYLEEKGIDMEKPKVVITLRPYRFPGTHDAQNKMKNYITSVADIATWLNKEGNQIVFFAHTIGPSAHETDALAIKEVTSILEERKVLYTIIEDHNLNCRDSMAIYACFDVLVGTRFHSVIFAQNSMVPSIAITYGGHKGDGIMKDAEMGEYALPIENVDLDKLIANFSSLLKNKDRIVSKLKEFHRHVIAVRSLMIKEIQSLQYY